MAVEQNRPALLRMVLSRQDNSSADGMRNSLNAILRATELGYEECIAIILSNQGRTTSFLTCKDSYGNNILHWCCRGSGNVSLLKMLLDHISGSDKGKQQLLSKIMLAKNLDLQATPFHEACRCDKVDFVEVFLNMCNNTLLSKVLATEDVNHQTPLLTAITNNCSDIVTTLIMWRYNHNSSSQNLQISFTNNKPNNVLKRGSQKQTRTTEHVCPLVWAAKCGNLEMIDLLLQFGDQSGNEYRVTEALHFLLLSSASENAKLEGVELLIGVGANPFEEISSRELAPSSASVLATKLASPSILRRIVGNGKSALKYQQLFRRRDPKLQLQPEAFFRALESKENVEMRNSIISALLETLHRASFSQTPSDFSLVEILYELGADVTVQDLRRLRVAIDTKTMPLEPAPSIERCAMAIYDHFFLPPNAKANSLTNAESDRAALEFGSLYLLDIPGVTQGSSCNCPWLSARMDCERQHIDFSHDEVMLISEDGSRFKIHEVIIGKKCEKLASAIRFNRMNRSTDTFGGIFELKVPIQAMLLQAMIQHFYHGSLAFWSFFKEEELCLYLLELMLVAEEYLCHDLVKEIEMRLLSSNPQGCFCWSCCRTVRTHPSQPFTVQCLYCVDTAGSLLAEKNILHVLGVTEYFGTPEYSLSLLPMSVASTKMERAEILWSSGLHMDALVVLKDCLKVVVLRNFSSFRRTFAEHFDRFHDCEEGKADVVLQKQALLHMCLNDLQANTLLVSLDEGSLLRTLGRTHKDCVDGSK
ncbi:ankyrin repeat domain protein [Nitzschia inconspicua]|uniref:Ankyrin repeat domain protein n=1 Tax=Nitzschia inconspicua TaxID=303405 RepID=A0A9K3KQ37_9STRA|nr:ankyrin repeat domain protein [Nitzschia inconspicua]